VYSIKIYLQGTDRHNEVLSDDVQTTELLVESMVSQVLLELFGSVVMQDVVVSFSPNESGETRNLTLL
jgi:hypothetical protein